MTILDWPARSTSKLRPSRPLFAWVQRLETRCLLTLQVSPISVVAGRSYSGIVATFAAGDVQGTTADYDATIYWPGAVNLTTTGTIVPTGPSSYAIYSPNIYKQPGSYPVTVVLTGANNSSAQGSGTATVTDAALYGSTTTINPQRQAPFSGVVASFYSSNQYATASDFQAFVNWGDGVNTHTPASIGTTYYGGFQVIGANTYQKAGTFPVTVTIVSPGGQQTVVNSTAVVSELPVNVLPNPITGSAGVPLTNATVATFLDPYLSDSATDFQATINWGDGAASAGIITAQGDGAFAIAGNHTYAGPGSYAVTVQVITLVTNQAAGTSSTATIGSPSPTFAFTGGLLSVYNNGPDAAQGITATRQPTFGGTAAAFGLVQLYGQPLHKKNKKSIYLGETVAGADGSWALTTGQLPAGTYVVTARVTPPSGYANQPIPLTSNGGTFSIGFSPSKAHSATRQRAALVARSSHVVSGPKVVMRADYRHGGLLPR